jgi:hypothetical protein
MGQASGGVLQGHGAGQPRAADRGAGGDVVDHQDRTQPGLRFVDMDHLVGTQIVGDAEDVAHRFSFSASVRLFEIAARRGHETGRLATGDGAVVEG